MYPNKQSPELMVVHALQVVALRGSLPADTLSDFRQVFSQYGRLKHSQKAQIADIFQELQQPR